MTVMGRYLTFAKPQVLAAKVDEKNRRLYRLVLGTQSRNGPLISGLSLILEVNLIYGVNTSRKCKHLEQLHKKAFGIIIEWLVYLRKMLCALSKPNA